MSGKKVTTDGVVYRKHYRDHAEGHIFLGQEKLNAVTIELTGAAAMTQEELDFYGEIIAEALNKLTPNQRSKAAKLAKQTRSYQPDLKDQ
jgi:hypothetical protein